jgi:hypothetical protein
MTNYTKTTDFAAKDSLPSGNAAKIVKGSEIDTEFNNIATASATRLLLRHWTSQVMLMLMVLWKLMHCPLMELQ